MVADLTPLLQSALSSNQIAARPLSSDGEAITVTQTEDNETADTIHTAKSSTQKNAR